MSFFKEWKFRAIVILTVLSLGLIMFGDPFKKGMDVAGGVELTYQIDFSKYRSIYPNDTDYTTAIQSAKNLIKNNITRRVNDMGVGDTEVRLLKVGTKDYIVVKVGGLTDIEAAKATIGKTVELEFKLPNTEEATPEQLAERKKLAEDLLVSINQDPTKMSQLAQGKQSDDVYYEAITRSWDQLPQVYKDNQTSLQTLSGLANQVIEGVYGQQVDASGAVQTVKGFFIIKVNGSNTIPSSQISDAKIDTITREFDTTVVQEDRINDSLTGTAVATGVIEVEGGLAIVNDLYVGQKAYKATIYTLPAVSGVVNRELVAQLTGLLVAGEAVGSGDYTKVLDNQWIDDTTLASIQTGLQLGSGEKVKVIDTAEGTVILSIEKTKLASDTLQQVRKISGSAISAKRDEIVKKLTTDVVYSVEQVFVKDTASWMPAVEKKFNRVLNGAYFQSATTQQGQAGMPVVSITFNKEGADIFCNLTAESVGKQMAIFVGGKLVTSPVIRDKICGGQAQIDGQFTDQTCSDPKNPSITHQAKDTLEGASCLVANLNEGALPAPLILSNEASLAPTLGNHAWTKAGYATILGLVLVFGLLWYMYNVTKAVIATVSLVVFLVVLLAFVKLTGYALSLSGIAAIILNIGMGVDSSILIFERLKEEKDRGLKTIPAILTAYERSWAPIFDGNFSTGLIGFVMALVGSDVFQGFGFMMAINNALLLLVAVPATKYLLLWWEEYKK